MSENGASISDYKAELILDRLTEAISVFRTSDSERAHELFHIFEEIKASRDTANETKSVLVELLDAQKKLVQAQELPEQLAFKMLGRMNAEQIALMVSHDTICRARQLQFDQMKARGEVLPLGAPPRSEHSSPTLEFTKGTIRGRFSWEYGTVAKAIAKGAWWFSSRLLPWIAAVSLAVSHFWHEIQTLVGHAR